MEDPQVLTCLCCMCGAPMEPNPAFMCLLCLRSRVDITEHIPRAAAVTLCKGCARWKVPPKAWVVAPLESRELLSLCLKRLPGLNTVHLTDAVFIWTEPHSRRINIKLTVQKEVFAAAILQQQLVVEFTVTTEQCPDCQKSYTEHTWVASVQVRQKVPHKRTFLYLEQLILKNRIQENTINIKEEKHGVDFYFNSRSHAQRFVDWLCSVVPAKYNTSKKLISHDIRNNTYHNKYSFSVEIAPVCKHDLVFLPQRTASSLGDFSRLVLVKKVASTFYLMDPLTGKTASVNPQRYYRDEFSSLLTSRQMINFIVLNVEPSSIPGVFDISVARERDFGANDEYYITRCDLPYLNPGDLVQGYDLNSMQFDTNLVGDTSNLPDVILVKKIYVRTRPRKYKLKRLAIEKADIKEENNSEADAEEFMKDIEEDAELRQTINLFKINPDEVDEIVPVEELIDDLEINLGVGGANQESMEN
ncbi:hypothetical protein RCL1_000548 [Eukaryota sp. TZLM3-RCL]